MVPIDSDGVVRHARGASELGGERIPSLPAVALELAGVAARPASQRGTHLIDFRRAAPPVPDLSILDVLEGASTPRRRGPRGADRRDRGRVPGSLDHAARAGPARHVGAGGRVPHARRGGARRAHARARAEAPCCFALALALALLAQLADELLGARRLAWFLGFAVATPAACQAALIHAGAAALARAARWRSSRRTTRRASSACGGGSACACASASCRSWRSTRSASPPRTRRARTASRSASACSAASWTRTRWRCCAPRPTAGSRRRASTGCRAASSRPWTWRSPPPRSRAAACARSTARSRGGPACRAARSTCRCSPASLPVGVLVVESRSRAPLGDTELRTVATVASQLALTVRSQRLAEDLRATLGASVEAIASAVEARDGYTELHCRRLALFCASMAHRLGLPAEEIEAIRLGALLHDVGKIGVRDHILLKPGGLPPKRDRRWSATRRSGTGSCSPSPGLPADDARLRAQSPRALGRHAATPTAWPARRSRWPRASSRSWTCGTRSRASAPTSRRTRRRKVRDILRKDRGTHFDPASGRSVPRHPRRGGRRDARAGRGQRGVASREACARTHWACLLGARARPPARGALPSDADVAQLSAELAQHPDDPARRCARWRARSSSAARSTPRSRGSKPSARGLPQHRPALAQLLGPRALPEGRARRGARRARAGARAPRGRRARALLPGPRAAARAATPTALRASCASPSELDPACSRAPRPRGIHALARRPLLFHGRKWRRVRHEPHDRRRGAARRGERRRRLPAASTTRPSRRSCCARRRARSSASYRFDGSRHDDLGELDLAGARLRARRRARLRERRVRAARRRRRPPAARSRGLSRRAGASRPRSATRSTSWGVLQLRGTGGAARLRRRTPVAATPRSSATAGATAPRSRTVLPLERWAGRPAHHAAPVRAHAHARPGRTRTASAPPSTRTGSPPTRRSRFRSRSASAWSRGCWSATSASTRRTRSQYAADGGGAGSAPRPAPRHGDRHQLELRPAARPKLVDLELRLRDTRHGSTAGVYDWDRQIVGTYLRLHFDR